MGKDLRRKDLADYLRRFQYWHTMNLYVHIAEEQKHKDIDLIADALKVVWLYFLPEKICM